MIVEEGGEWLLKTAAGDKILGRHKTREEAEAQERAVQWAKHADALPAVAAGAVARYDRAELLAPTQTAEGFLRLEGHTARVGVQRYVGADGQQVRELRLPEEVSSPETLDSIRLMPVTNSHPPGLLTPDDVQRFAMGAVGEDVRFDGEWVNAPLAVWARELIDAIRGGRSQLSWGYSCELDASPPDPELVAKWGEYDVIQRRIRGNHLACVDAARAGSGATLRLDGQTRRVVASEKEETKQMPYTIRVDGMEIQVESQNAQVIIDRAIAAARKAGEDLAAQASARADAAEKNLKSAMRQADQARGRFDAMKARSMACDECGGTGKVMGDSGDAKACDYCDGSGSYRMFDKFKDAFPPPKSEAEGAPGEETPAGEAEEDKADAAGWRRACEAAKKARKDSVDRMVRRRLGDEQKKLAARATLTVDARRALGRDFKLDALSDDEVRAAVVKKLTPKAKVDGKSADYVRALYDSAIAELPNVGGEREDEETEETEQPERPRAKVLPMMDGAKARQAMLERNAAAFKK